MKPEWIVVVQTNICNSQSNKLTVEKGRGKRSGGEISPLNENMWIHYKLVTSKLGIPSPNFSTNFLAFIYIPKQRFPLGDYESFDTYHPKQTKKKKKNPETSYTSVLQLIYSFVFQQCLKTKMLGIFFDLRHSLISYSHLTDHMVSALKIFIKSKQFL